MEERARLGMAMFLMSQAVFFLFLIIGWIYFKRGAFDVTYRYGLYTVSLAASSFTVWRATSRNAGKWLVATILLGGAFFVGYGLVYLHAFPFRNQASAVFTLVVCHELYTAVGILLLGIALWRPAILRTVALYWYFVVVVWAAILAVAWIV